MIWGTLIFQGRAHSRMNKFNMPVLKFNTQFILNTRALHCPKMTEVNPLTSELRNNDAEKQSGYRDKWQW